MYHGKISLLQFSNSLARGGVEEHILTLLRGLDRNLFNLHLVCTRELDSRIRGGLPSDVEVLPLDLYRPTQIAAALSLARILQQRRVDILHSHGFYGSLFASPVGWLCRVPVIVETSHAAERWRHGWFKSRFIVDRFVGRMVDRYISVCHANVRYLVEEKGLPAAKIQVIRNGCDLRQFDPAGPVPPGLREELGFGDNDPIVVVVGRLEPQKGHRVLLEALPALRREFPRLRVVCVGAGRLRHELEQQAAGLGLSDCVRFVGEQSLVAPWLALADVSVLPSWFEGLPLVAIESLAAGRAIVATAADGIPEVVVNGVTGLTVPAGDPVQLGEAIARLLKDPNLRLSLGRAGRQWVKDNFSQERQVLETQGLYLECVARNRRNQALKQFTAEYGLQGRQVRDGKFRPKTEE